MTTGMTAASAVVARRDGAGFAIEDVLVPDPVRDEVRVAVDAVGMCHADLAARDGDFPVPLPAVLGHEGTGLVTAVGPAVRDVAIGDRVVLTFDACHRCRACRSGWLTRCEHYMEMNFGTASTTHGAARSVRTATGDVFASFFGQSSFATVALASERNAVVVPDEAPAHLLAPLGCAVQTGAGAVLCTARPAVGAVVAVVGLGPVGFSALIAAACFTPSEEVIAVDVNSNRLALAAELGASRTIDARDDPDLESLRGSGGVDVILECSGSPRALEPALASLRRGGTLVQVGAPAFGTTAPFDVAAVVNGSITIRGTVEGDSRPREIITWLERRVVDGRWPLHRLIQPYRMDEATTAADDMTAGLTIKPVLIT